LQTFLETGFDTFRGMRQPAQFLGWIASRERALADVLFDDREDGEGAAVLGQLP
jgi:hypothetical protein